MLHKQYILIEQYFDMINLNGMVYCMTMILKMKVVYIY